MKRNETLISLNTLASSAATVLSLDNGDTITNLYDIANPFNNYFASIAETTNKSIKYWQKPFSDYFANETGNTIFLESADKEEEIADIISSFNSNKSSGPNNIPSKNWNFEPFARFIQPLLYDQSQNTVCVLTLVLPL